MLPAQVPHVSDPTTAHPKRGMRDCDRTGVADSLQQRKLGVSRDLCLRRGAGVMTGLEFQRDIRTITLPCDGQIEWRDPLSKADEAMAHMVDLGEHAVAGDGRENDG